MTALRVINSVEPLLEAHVKMARRHGFEEIRIPVARAVSVMNELRRLRETVRREQRPRPFMRDIHPV
jgi:hypothetical protein